MPVKALKHLQAMRASSDITRTLRRMYWPEALMITPAKLIGVLNRAGVSFVLMGNYGMTGWRGEERATQVVDVLVRKSHLRKAEKAIRKAFPKLEAEDFPAVTRFLEPATGKVLIDMMKPIDPIYRAVFKYTIAVGKTHRIPDLEMALVCKFAAMISPGRLKSKKQTDAGDFIEMVKHNYQAIDLDKLRLLGEIVYAGGGREVAEYVDAAQHDRDFKI